jgi:hypothetical protein
VTGKQLTPANRLGAFVRDHSSGGCRVLTLGDQCECPLCDIDRLRHDARRYQLLKQRFLGADFAWGERSECVLVFEMKPNERIGADLDLFCDTVPIPAGGAGR